MFVGWEGVGLCSYLLIGFWFEKKSASDAGNKAFLVNRVGDAGLLLGMILAFHAFGTLDLVDIAGNIGSKPPEAFGELGVVTAVALLLFVGACGKSAQIPLHVWLPDAMEGPTPVSALIHAATMVTAGVYMVARLAPLYALSETAMAVVAVVGATTALMAATIALVQTDIKRVLAYSTVSQLGYMFLACGVGAFGVAIFHLFTHAFFKALLFLASGSVIHALSGEQDMRRMGGLRTPPLAGFFSKDAILAGALEGGHTALFAVGLFTALLTAFYMGRLLFGTFLGSFRGGDEAEHHVHESPWTMLGPLVALAVGCVGVGFVHHATWLPWVATATAVMGLVAAYYLYVMFTDLPGRLSARLRPLQRVLEAKWGFDLAFNWLVSRGVVAGSEGLLWRRFDVAVIDGAVNGAARVVNGVSAQARQVQTGLVRGYALVILGGQTGLVRGYALVILGGAVTLLAYLLWM